MKSLSQDKIVNRSVYALIGTNAGLGLFLVFYWLLLQTSTLTAFYYNTGVNAIYMWTYISTTIASVVLFGVNIALAVYLFRRTGKLALGDQSGAITGGVVGAFAAACPVCGAFLLSLIGVAGGLVSLPFNGLELKIASLALIVLSVWLMRKKIRHPLCKDGACPAPETGRFTTHDISLVFALGFLLFVLLWIGWGMLQAEPSMSLRV